MGIIVTRSYYGGTYEDLHVFGSEGVDDLSDIDDADPSIYDRTAYRDVDKAHSLMVLSALMTVARNVKVVFVKLDIKFDADPTGDGGFALNDEEMYEWIINNTKKYNIKVMTTSFDKFGIFINNFGGIADKGVYMMAAIGNDGLIKNSDPQSDYYFPTYLDQVHGIGSIDHEDRGAVKIVDYINGIPIKEYIPDYYSEKGHIVEGHFLVKSIVNKKMGK